MKLALIQAPADLGPPEERLNWLDIKLTEISESAELVLLPELFACGYAIGAKINVYAEPRNGRIAAELAGLALKHGIAVHCGYAERDGRTLYNSALCVGPDGKELSHQRKLAIPPGFERTYFTAGKGCTLFTYRSFKIATLICYDAEFPETFRHVAALGVDLVLVPTALGACWGWVAETMLPTRAYENGVFLAYANSAGTQNELAFLGSSVIAAPDGEELARAGNAPQILYAELDKSRVQAAQARLPYLIDRTHIQLN